MLLGQASITKSIPKEKIFRLRRRIEAKLKLDGQTDKQTAHSRKYKFYEPLLEEDWMSEKMESISNPVDSSMIQEK